MLLSNKHSISRYDNIGQRLGTMYPIFFVIVKIDLNSTISTSVFEQEPKASTIISPLTSIVQELNVKPRILVTTI